MNKNKSFISYSRKDLEFVRRLVAALQDCGIDPWFDMDKQDLPKGVLWQQEILTAIQFSDNFIYVISPDSIASKYCDMELDHALALNKRLIPIVIRGIQSAARASINELNWIFFNENFEIGFNDLLELLDSPLGRTYGDRLDSCIKISDPLGTRSFCLYRNKYLIGRSPKADYAEAGLLLVADPIVSRCHATLFRKDSRWYVADGLLQLNKLGNPVSYQSSSNGLFIEHLNEVGGGTNVRQRLRPFQIRPLIHQDIVRMSPSTTFMYEEVPDLPNRSFEPDEKDTFVDDHEQR